MIFKYYALFHQFFLASSTRVYLIYSFIKLPDALTYKHLLEDFDELVEAQQGAHPGGVVFGPQVRQDLLRNTWPSTGEVVLDHVTDANTQLYPTENEYA